MTDYYKIDPYHKLFRNRSMFQSQRIDLSLGDDELRKSIEKRFSNYAGKRVYVMRFTKVYLHANYSNNS